MVATRVFFLGATGYVGGPVAQRLIDRGFKLTALVRSDDSRAAALRERGAETVVGTLESVDLIKEQASQADAVFACATNNHLPSTEAILAGFKEKKEKTGAVGILVQTSGTGIYTTGDARGLAPGPESKVYSDEDIAAIEALGTAHPQRKVHVRVIESAEKGEVRSFFVLPSTIFGVSSEKGVVSIFSKHSNQMPALIRGSLRKKQAGLVGEYKNTCASRPLVHTDDLTDLYSLVLDAAFTGKDAGSGRTGFYNAANGQYVGVEAAAAVGEAMYKRGLAKTKEPARFTEEEMKANYGAYANFAGTNSQATSERSRRLGWQPKHDHASFIASLDYEVESIYKEEFEGK
ncbi:hypothetical protein JCM6882_001123 [Rhodosporidiobolus microsporus]